MLKTTQFTLKCLNFKSNHFIEKPCSSETSRFILVSLVYIVIILIRTNSCNIIITRALLKNQILDSRDALK